MSAAIPPSPPIRVFILDDHEVVRCGIRALVNAERIVVVGESGSAQEAARRIPELAPDVMLLDVQLPDGSGIDVCRRVRSLNPAIHGLMLTSFDDDRVRLAAVLAGARGFVVKQVRGGELITAIRRVAAGENLLDRRSIDDTLGHARQRLHTGDPRSSLTGQEHRILELIGTGQTNRQIGQVLGITEKTVKGYVTAVLAKLGVENRTQAAVLSTRMDGP